jgi:hypothetical protein
MLCAWSSQYPHRPIPPDQSRSVEINLMVGSVVVPATAVLQGLSDHFVFSSDRARHSVWRAPWVCRPRDLGDGRPTAWTPPLTIIFTGI